jgi:hypothetical protein
MIGPLTSWSKVFAAEADAVAGRAAIPKLKPTKANAAANLRMLKDLLVAVSLSV